MKKFYDPGVSEATMAALALRCRRNEFLDELYPQKPLSRRQKLRSWLDRLREAVALKVAPWLGGE